jgi:hypothetical protein
VTVPFGPVDWDVTVLGRPVVCEADATGRSGALAAAAAAALVALDADDAAGEAVAAARLGPAGVVALRDGGRTVEVHETLDGWTLVPASVPTPDVDDLAAAAFVRAHRLAAARRAGEGRW